MQIKGWEDSTTIKGLCTETKEGFSMIFASMTTIKKATLATSREVKECKHE
jgi:hypothetical protein